MNRGICRSVVLLGLLACSLGAAEPEMTADAIATGTPRSNNQSAPLELTFNGPFSYRQLLVKSKSPVTRPWVEVMHMAISDRSFQCLDVIYQFKGTADPRRRIRIVVSATTADGKTRILADGWREDHRLLKPAWGGSSIRYFAPTISEALSLPTDPRDILKLTVRLEGNEVNQPVGSDGLSSVPRDIVTKNNGKARRGSDELKPEPK